MMEWFLITEIMSFLEFNKNYTKTLRQNIYESNVPYGLYKYTAKIETNTFPNQGTI